MMSAKMATLGLLQIKVFLNKGFIVIIPIHDVKNKTLSQESYYIVYVVMWPMFVHSRVSMKGDKAQELKLKVRKSGS